VLYRGDEIMPQFVLKITLGNEAMQTGRDVSSALKKVSTLIEEDRVLNSGENWTVHDMNGNIVGCWRVE